MRLNGLSFIISAAVKEIGDPLLCRYERAIILGAFREDVWYVPWIDRVIEHASLTHFVGRTLPGGFIPLLVPGADRRAAGFFAKALRCSGQGKQASAFVQLGRASHLLIDMACPAHADRVVHGSDPFEWFVEGHRPALSAMPSIAPEVEASEPGELVRALARLAQACRPDMTTSWHGQWLRRMGLRERVPMSEVREQAETLVPAAIGHSAALFRLFLARVAGQAADTEHATERTTEHARERI